MKKITIFFLFAGILLSTGCQKEDTKDPVNDQPGIIEFELDNIALVDGIVRQLRLAPVGDTEYDLTNGMDQPFNITLLRYFVTNVVLEGPNGERYEDEMSVSATASKGYYLVDEADTKSQLIKLENVPAGRYNRLSFTIGVDEAGVMEGAAGGALDPATNNMFWNWNSGYIAVKFEGQSNVSAGGANGESIKPDNANGLVYHVGGWKDVPGTAFVYNNRLITLDFDTEAVVNGDEEPHVHIFVDVLRFFTGANAIDFTGNNNVHKPTDGKPVAENLESAFRYDHIHQ